MRSLILFAFVLLTAPPGRAQKQFTIPVDVDLVLLNVTVTDGDGRAIRGLKPEDFQIREDNRLQTIQLFNADDIPASVGLIIDNSGSMRGRSADVANAALAFVGASNPEDEMFVVSFNEKVFMGLPPSLPFTSDPAQMRSALCRNSPGGLTALYDALAVGLEHLKSGTRDRKALVVLSDGGDNASRHRLDDVLQIAQRSSATIYTIGVYEPTSEDRNPGVLRKVAQQSGGRAYFPDTVVELDQSWRAIADAIRSQYTIGYHSTNIKRDGAFRKLNVTAPGNGGRNLRVTTREGYLAPGE